jgi:hypothetical protein
MLFAKHLSYSQVWRCRAPFRHKEQFMTQQGRALRVLIVSALVPGVNLAPIMTLEIE